MSACNRSTLLKKLKNISAEYRPISFWFINHFIKEDEIRRQIKEMFEKGFGGFVFHARDGLRSNYLEYEWERGLQVAIEEASKYNFSVFLYDENHYPSGIAGGKIFQKYPDKTMMSLVCVCEREIKNGQNFKITLPADKKIKYAFVVSDDGYAISLKRYIKEGYFKWKNNLNKDVTLLLFAEEKQRPVPGQRFEYYPDYLCLDVVKEFINLTHEWYQKKFGRFFGTTIKGIFTDNACANFGYIRRSIPWTTDFDKRFEKKIGIKIEKILPGLFIPIKGYKEARLQFWRFMGKEFIENFVKPINKFCKKNKLWSTGHFCLEDGMAEHIRQIGDRFDLKRNQSLPGVDHLGPYEKGGNLFYNSNCADIDNCSAIKSTSSAALFYDSPRVLCECFGLASGWNLDLGEIKRISGFLACLGIDLFVVHGLYYSIAGSRKWECTPDHFHNPIWQYYREWSDWITQISFLTTQWESLSEVAVLYPSTTLMSYIELGTNSTFYYPYEHSDRGIVCDLIEDTYRNIINFLVKKNICFEIIDEKILQKGSIQNGKMCVPTRKGRASCNFSVIILPCIKILEKPSWEQLNKFHKAGGSIIMVNGVPEAIFDTKTCKISEISNPELTKGWPFLNQYNSNKKEGSVFGKIFDIIQTKTRQPLYLGNTNDAIISRVWKKWNYTFYMLHNCTYNKIPRVTIYFRDKTEPFLLDLHKLTLKKICKNRNEQFVCTKDFSPAETLIFISGKDIKPSTLSVDARAPNWSVIEIEKRWDFFPLSKNVLPLRESYVNYNGKTHQYIYEFYIKHKPSIMKVVLDHEMMRSELICDRYSERLRCILNGKTINRFSPGGFGDRWMFESDITHYIKKGKNTLCIEVSGIFLETDRKMWEPKLLGTFRIEKNSHGEIIVKQESKIYLGDWVKQGYPYYVGECAYRKTIKLPEICRYKKLRLNLGQLKNAVELVVNGESLGRKILPPWEYDISQFNTEKEINVEIRILNTANNLFNNTLEPSGLFGPVIIKYC